MENIISDSERSQLFDQEFHDYFKVIITYRFGRCVHTSRLAVRTDNVSAFMNAIYDRFTNDAVIQFNGIFQQKDSRFWFTMV